MQKFKDLILICTIIMLVLMIFDLKEVNENQKIEYKKAIDKKYEELQNTKQFYENRYLTKYAELIDKENELKKKNEELDKQKERLNISEEIMNETNLDYEAVHTLIDESIDKKIPISLMLGLIEYESNFDPENKNPNSTATGLGQFLHSTARWVAEKNGMQFEVEYLTDPSYNIKLIALYLNYLYETRGSWEGALKGYGDQTATYHKRVFDRSVKYTNYNFDIMFYTGQLEK